MDLRLLILVALCVVAIETKSFLLLDDVTIATGKHFVYQIGDKQFLATYRVYRIVERGQKGLPDWLKYNNQTSQLIGSPQESDLGLYTIRVRSECIDPTATPNCQDRISRTFHISVVEPLTAAESRGRPVMPVHVGTVGKHGKPSVKTDSESYLQHESNLQHKYTNLIQPTRSFLHENPTGVSPPNSSMHGVTPTLSSIDSSVQHGFLISNLCEPNQVSFFASLILHVLHVLSESQVLDLKKRMAEFSSKDDSLISVTAGAAVLGSLQNSSHKHIITAGPGNIIESLSNSIELSWHVLCNEFEKLTDFTRVLQHNIEVGRITEELGYDVIAWFVYSDRPVPRRQKRSAHSHGRKTGTPSFSPPLPTTVESMSSLYASFSSTISPVSISTSLTHTGTSTVSIRPPSSELVSSTLHSSLPSSSLVSMVSSSLVMPKSPSILFSSSHTVSISPVVDSISISPISTMLSSTSTVFATTFLSSSFVIYPSSSLDSSITPFLNSYISFPESSLEFLSSSFTPQTKTILIPSTSFKTSIYASVESTSMSEYLTYTRNITSSLTAFAVTSVLISSFSRVDKSSMSLSYLTTLTTSSDVLSPSSVFHSDTISSLQLGSSILTSTEKLSTSFTVTTYLYSQVKSYGFSSSLLSSSSSSLLFSISRSYSSLEVSLLTFSAESSSHIFRSEFPSSSVSFFSSTQISVGTTTLPLSSSVLPNATYSFFSSATDQKYSSLINSSLLFTSSYYTESPYSAYLSSLSTTVPISEDLISLVTQGISSLFQSSSLVFDITSTTFQPESTVALLNTSSVVPSLPINVSETLLSPSFIQTSSSSLVLLLNSSLTTLSSSVLQYVSSSLFIGTSYSFTGTTSSLSLAISSFSSDTDSDDLSFTSSNTCMPVSSSYVEQSIALLSSKTPPTSVSFISYVSPTTFIIFDSVKSTSILSPSSSIVFSLSPMPSTSALLTSLLSQSGLSPIQSPSTTLLHSGLSVDSISFLYSTPISVTSSTLVISSSFLSPSLTSSFSATSSPLVITSSLSSPSLTSSVSATSFPLVITSSLSSPSLTSSVSATSFPLAIASSLSSPFLTSSVSATSSLLAPSTRVLPSSIAVTPSSTEAMTSSVVPTTAAPDSIPDLQVAIDHLEVYVGRYFMLKIPEKTFNDTEDGSTSNLNLSISLVYGKPFPSDSWLMFDPGTQKLYGLPLMKDLESGENKHVLKKFILTAADSKSQIAKDVISVAYKYDKDVTHDITVNFDGDFNEFAADRNILIGVAQRIVKFYGDSDLKILTFVEMQNGSITINWGNNTLFGKDCRRQEIQDMFDRLVDTNGSVSRNLTRLFSGIVPVPVSATLEFKGACTLPLTTLPPSKRPLPTADDEKFWLTIGLPALVVILVIIIIALLLLVCCRHRSSSKEVPHSDKPAFLEDRRPIIFPEELEMMDPSLKAKNPLILPSDYLVETPPAVPPHGRAEPPTYKAPVFDDSLLEADQQPLAPPPPGVAETATDPPPYRLPPPYYNPHRAIHNS